MRDRDINELKISLGIHSSEETCEPGMSPVAHADVVRMAEIFFLLSLHETGQREEDGFVRAARKTQTEIGVILAHCYEEGDPELGISRDPFKARKYIRKSNPKHLGEKTEEVYNAFRWFNACRLFVVRLARILRFSGISTLRAVLANIAWLTSIGGLSYGIEVLVDMGIVLKTTFSPDNKQGTAWQRLVAVLTKDNRPHRLANALVWFGVNLSCFFLTGGAAAILNVALFAFDVFNDAYKGYRDMSGYWRLIETFDRKIKASQDPGEIAKYTFLRRETQQKLKSVFRVNAYQVLITLTVLTGMVLIFFPPAALTTLFGFAAIQMVGAALAFSGSLFGGLGKKLYTTIRSSSEKPEETALPPEEVPVVTPEQPERVRELVRIHETSTRVRIRRNSFGDRKKDIPELSPWETESPCSPPKVQFFMRSRSSRHQLNIQEMNPEGDSQRSHSLPTPQSRRSGLRKSNHPALFSVNSHARKAGKTHSERDFLRIRTLTVGSGNA